MNIPNSKSAAYGLALLAVVVLAACGAVVEGTEGEETSPCNEGQCLGDLECRSDLCVDLDWAPGSSGAGGSGSSVDPSGEPGTTGSATSSDSNETTESTGSPPGTSGDPTVDPSTSGDPTWGSSSSGGSSSGRHGDCGDGFVSPGEQCDPPDFQGLDCSALGLGTGTLACDPVTCTFDTSMCNTGSGGTSG